MTPPPTPASLMEEARTIQQVMQEIYDKEQNVEISNFWDAGWTARIGDRTNGFVPNKASGICDTFEEAVRWLEQELLPYAKEKNVEL